MTSLKLDEEIRNWVLIPIIFVMILQGFIRQYATEWMREESKVDLEQLRKTNLIRRSVLLRANGHYIPVEAFEMRKDFFVYHAFKEEKKKPDEPPQMPDPSASMGPMKQQFAMMLPNMLMMGWCSYFFEGFVIAKLPFGLTQRFKVMLQKGIMLSSLEVSYISALSWYLVAAMGLRDKDLSALLGFFTLALGADNAADNAAMMKAQMGMPQQQPGMPVDFKPLFAAERNELEITQHSFLVVESKAHMLALAQN